MNQVNKSMSLANPSPPFTDAFQKVASAVGSVGLLFLFVAAFGGFSENQGMMLTIALLLIATGTIAYSWRVYAGSPEGIKNNGVWFNQLTNKGLTAWIAGIVITGFYVFLYWFPTYLGKGVDGANVGLIGFFDPLSQALKGQPASEWFVYGTLYTLAILIFGFKFILKYRHNTYQIVRTISVMFFQLGFAFLLPEILQRLNQPYYDFKNMWPLNYYFFFDWNIENLLSGGNLGLFMIFWGIVMIFVISPVLTYFYGKRWYCSWVCGCGGLAETTGDPFRHLSDKSLKAWKIERWLIYSVLVFAVVMTIAVLFSFFSNNPTNFIISKTAFLIIVLAIMAALSGLAFNYRKDLKETGKKVYPVALTLIGIISALTIIAYFTGSWNVFLIDSYSLRSWYGFFIGAIFSGVVGVGFYPLMGSRVWCRFGCPMAAILGIQQKFFSRFRITTNGGQCISCGNCSTYCEMGIDVRSYAQKGQNVVRASCVGCGICAAVCPRGVLRLENGSADIGERTAELKAIHITEDQIKILN
jgi:polyferredoxin